MRRMTRLAMLAPIVLLACGSRHAATATEAKDVDFQPLAAQGVRVAEALESLGAPLPPEDRKALDAATKSPDTGKGVEAIQNVLDKHCLLLVEINPESRVKVARGAADAQLVEGGWRTFLVKVAN